MLQHRILHCKLHSSSHYLLHQQLHYNLHFGISHSPLLHLQWRQYLKVNNRAMLLESPIPYCYQASTYSVVVVDMAADTDDIVG